MENNKKNPLFEADYLERALDFIDRYAKKIGKSPTKINAIRAKVEDKLKAINPNVSKSSALKTFKGTMDDKNKMDERKNNDITKSDIEKLLEYIEEADKAKKQESEPKKEAKPKQEPKKEAKPKQEPKQEPKQKAQPKEKSADEEQKVSPSEAVTKLMKSSGGANFMQDVRRMGSKQQRIESYLQLIMSLPGIGNSEVRRAIVNKLKVSEK
jgi:outer membrane biosynthesis protein TonB